MTDTRALGTLVLALVAVAAAWPGRARADRYEASLAVEAGAGLARVGERGADSQQVPALLVGARFTHAWSNRLAWDASLAGTFTSTATFPDAEADFGGRPTRGDITRRTLAGRAEFGAELRLGAGVGVIPTARIAIGPQLRYRGGSDLGVIENGVPAASNLDLAVSLGFGADLRLGRSRVVGIAAGLAHAQPLGDGNSFDTVLLTLRFASYWYPRWWSPDWSI